VNVAADGSESQPGRRRVAAIDCGTNSLRLLIADVEPGRAELTDVDRRMEIVRLGQGVDATGRLAREALERTFRVLAEYARAIRDAGTGAVRMVATSATRDASNAGEFVRGVTQILGVAPEVISGDEEAALSFTGATAELGQPELADGEQGSGGGPQPPFLVVDIGGGSTEFVLGDGASAGGASAGGASARGASARGASAGGASAGGASAGGGSEYAPPGQRLAAASMNIGCVRLTERYLHADPPETAEIQAATADIDAALTEVAVNVPVARARSLVGLAGSVTTVTGIALELPVYDAARIHHARIRASRVHEVTLSLLGQTREQRAGIGVMHPGRVDVIGAGALILDRIMNRFGFAEVVASEHDILDGIAWSIVAGGR
jgi:exopolyphosphatase / guanosine-5'-triphosphate,3'-diphosphate pyrophosphatase